MNEERLDITSPDIYYNEEEAEGATKQKYGQNISDMDTENRNINVYAKNKKPLEHKVGGKRIRHDKESVKRKKKRKEKGVNKTETKDYKDNFQRDTDERNILH